MSQSVSVYVEEFSTREESRREVARFSCYDLALRCAQVRVRRCMRDFHRRGQSAKDLFDLWFMFGEDVYIVPDDRRAGFSAIDYGRLIAMELACDPTLRNPDEQGRS
ncbi:MAG: hypothetical protein K2W95_00060 [Candidatus Obscuribacterales bacterium]|nr:hypothetical protein [Candidatus Obscuribacterales bacterium]